MKEIIENIVITGAIFTQENCLIGMFLEKAVLTKERIIKYGIAIVMAVLIGSILGLEKKTIIFWAVALIICLCYEGNIFQKAVVFIFGLAIGCAAGLVDMIMVDALGRESMKQLFNNGMFEEIRSALEIGVMTTILKKSGMFNIKQSYINGLGLRRGISMCLSAVAAIFVNAIAVDIYSGGINGLIQERGVVSCVIFGSLFFTAANIVALGDDMSKQYYKWENEHIQDQLQCQLKYYQHLEKISKSSRAIKHDMKNHMIVVNQLLEKKDLKAAKDYIINMEDTISKIKEQIFTGNSIIDAILSEKITLSKDKNIEFLLKADISQQLKFDAIDLCVIIANSIDNAIEACMKIQDKKKRKIQVECCCKAGYFIYNIINTTQEPVIIIQNKITTSKHDTLNHGYGLDNIRNSVLKYDGDYKIEYKKNTFRLYCALPITNT